MKITLRKAHALTMELANTVNDIEFDNEIEIGEFENPVEAVDKAVATFYANEEKRGNMYDVLYSLRQKVAVANTTANVTNILAEIARIEKDIAFFKFHAGAKVRATNEVLVSKLEKIKEVHSEPRGYMARGNDAIYTSIFEESDIASFKKNLARAKKVKVALQDSLLETNIRTEIELSDEEVTVLKAADLL